MGKDKMDRKKEKRDKKDKKEKRDRKRKEREENPEVGSMSSESEPMNESEVDSQPKKKAKLLSGIFEKASGKSEEDYANKVLMKGAKSLTEYKDILDASIIQSLEAQKFNSLFEIQVKTLPSILEGKDVLARARTGMGKSLAFALPVVQQMIANAQKSGSKSPKVVVLAPTRELAKQVAKEFEMVATKFKVLTVYGGVSISDQVFELRNGVDIVVGTPGRVIDHIDRGSLKLDEVRHFILDEADQMLDMGFSDDMDKVFDSVKAQRQQRFQVLLFSATLPEWVNQVARKKMQDPVTIDLVGDLESASKDVEHHCISCHWDIDQRASLIGDLVKMYAGSQLGRAIVFCNRKHQCDDLAGNNKLARVAKVIHGDVTQAQRESTLQAFRSGNFKVLIATDVAARGLDIKNVDLVVNFEPPCMGQNPKMGNKAPRADVDTYVHRSGRTGRAGKKGVCVTLFSQKQEALLDVIEKQTKSKLQRVGAPQTDDLLLGSARAQIEDVLRIPEEVCSKFFAIAEEMIEFHGAKKSIAMLLAKVTGFEEAKSVAQRSLLASEKGFVTVKYENRFKNPGEIRLGYVWTVLRSLLSEDPDLVEKTKGMQILKSELGAAFDVPQAAADIIKRKLGNGDKASEGFEICTSLPEVKKRDFQPQQNGNGGRGGGRSSFSRGGGGGRGRGGGGRGRGGGRRF